MKISIFIIMVFTVMLWGLFMPSKIEDSGLEDIDRIAKELRSASAKKIFVGVVGTGDSELLAYAAANEYGATITPKNTKFLAVPVRPEAKGKSPREFSDLVPIFPKKGERGSPILAVVNGKDVIPYYVLKKKIIIPERSYIRSTLDNKQAVDKAVKLAQDAVYRIISGEASGDAILLSIGESLKSSIKATIASNVPPENSPLTKSLKRGDRTLVDEGRLIKSIGYEIV
jgi:hypothetical protein